jgi:hypothetical protein
MVLNAKVRGGRRSVKTGVACRNRRRKALHEWLVWRDLMEWMVKKILFLISFVYLTGSLYSQNTSDFEIQGNDDGTMTILNYKGMVKEVVIPEKIFNMPVTRLREGAFEEKGLTKVTIPSTVTYIGNDTFYKNQLTSVTIPETMEYIGNNAFNSNQLTSVTIPGKVVTIGAGAFRGNRLTSVTIPHSVTYIGNYAFANNSITNVTIGNGVAFIGSSAFYGDYYNGSERNQITSITLGTGIKYIGSSAFQNHRASSIAIPDNVVFVGSMAFAPYSQNSLVNITIGKYVMFGVNSSYVDGGAFSNNGNFDTIYQNNDKRAGKYTLANGNWTYTQ